MCTISLLIILYYIQSRFKLNIEHVFKNMLWDKGVSAGGQRGLRVSFEDDMMIMVDCSTVLKRMRLKLEDKIKEYCIKTNIGETRGPRINDRNHENENKEEKHSMSISTDNLRSTLL